MRTRERQVLNRALSSIIKMDWRIKFVGMVDRNGKLLVGRSKGIPFCYVNHKHADITRTSTHMINSKVDDLIEIIFRYKNMYLFYSDYLLWVVGNCIAHLNNYEIKYRSYFEILGCSNGDVKLAVAPLNVIRKTFLCIYFEPAYSTRNPNVSEEGLEELLNKISSSIL
jgi:hypothetical protein